MPSLIIKGPTQHIWVSVSSIFSCILHLNMSNGELLQKIVKWRQPIPSPRAIKVPTLGSQVSIRFLLLMARWYSIDIGLVSNGNQGMPAPSESDFTLSG